MLVIGVDPGVKTGLAVWSRDTRAFVGVDTLGVIAAMEKVRSLKNAMPVRVVFEDARLRKWFGGRDANQRRYGAGVREGAGSVKRDAKLWQEFCEFHGIEYQAVPPMRGATKWSAEKFQSITGWTGRTSSHARDAALLVWGK